MTRAHLLDGRLLGRLGAGQDAAQRVAVRGVGAAQVEDGQGAAHPGQATDGPTKR